MTTPLTSLQQHKSGSLPKKMLNASATLWFISAMVGQAIFSYYIVLFYYQATAVGDLQRFNQVMPAGHIEGDLWGNIAVVFHVLFAAIITMGGLIQLFPFIRSKWPSLHRWNGRIYVAVAMIMSFSGLFMVVTRYEQLIGNAFGHLAITANGIIMVVCAIMALRLARQKNYRQHRVWALRLFLAVSGVWMFRVGLMAWLSIHGKPVGFDMESFSGPFINGLYIAVYIAPLLLLELYLKAQTSRFNALKLSTACLLILISCAMIVGVFSATMGMWLPRIQ